MATEPILTGEAPAPIGPYSQAIRSGGELFCSGQIAIDPSTGETVDCDVAAQTERVLQNLGAVLRAGGFDYADVVKTTIFLLDMADFGAVNAVYERYFGVAKPARSTVAVAGLPRNVRIESEAIAKQA